MHWYLPGLATAVLVAVLTAPAASAQQPSPAPSGGAVTAPSAVAAPTATEAATAGAEAPPVEAAGAAPVLVLGAGLGGHKFATPYHPTQTVADVEMRSVLMWQVYGEWYALEGLALGLRLIAFGGRVTSSASVTAGAMTAEASNQVELKVTNLLATVNWIPIGRHSYFRLGLQGGLGRSNYTFTERNVPGGSTTNASSGNAALLGVYVDWGEDGIGGRFGVQYLATDLGDVNGKPVDVSGRDIYFDLRWAF